MRSKISKMIIICKFFVPKGFSAIALYPFIFIRDKSLITPTRINHEKIHLRQQAELLVLPFYLLYGLDYIVKLVRFKNKRQAYLNIFFEREAYNNQHNETYLDTRRLFASFDFVKNP